jgi:hypothetical protein
MENKHNILNYDLEQLQNLYKKSNNDFQKFFIKKVIQLKLTKNNINKNTNNINNNTNIIKENNVINDLLNSLIDNENNDIDNDINDVNNINDNENKINKPENKMDICNNKLLDRLNNEAEFRKTGKEKIFVSPFIDDNTYDEQFKNSDNFVKFKEFDKQSSIKKFTDKI